MISIIYSTHKEEKYNNDFKKHLFETVGLKNVQILQYQNNNEYSLSEIYNKGISESLHDIIVCCHNDIKLESGWGKKLLKDFELNPDFSIIGKAGSCYFPESGVYWEKMNETMVGQVYHHPIGSKKWLSQYSAKLPFIVPVVTLDGLFISFNKNKIKHLFDESIGRFHFYDHLFCLPNYLDGVKIGVTSSFEITHMSVGKPNQEFVESKEKFISKFSKNLPILLKPKNVFVEEIKRKKTFHSKVAIVIPTKENFEMLKDCIESFYKFCDSSLFKIFIADTGSCKETIQKIESVIELNNNIELIKYDYYNFAKINNDVVKNYINDEFEFLLFCNNDIKILNDVIYEMLNTFHRNPNCGTVGARLHYSDGLIQHCGMYGGFWDNMKNFHISHIGLKSHYNYKTSEYEVLGNTAALMMIRKKVFIKCGMFNENYLSCFEDVELNLNCLILGYKNILSGKSVAYHYESQTRNLDSDKLDKLGFDYLQRLYPFVIKNHEKFKNKIFYK